MVLARFLVLTILTLAVASANDLVAKVKAATAFISVPGTGSSGSTFCISDKGHFATCAHVIGNFEPGKVVDLTIHAGLPDAKEFKATLVKIDHSLDLAILKAEPGLATPLKIGTGKLLKETDPITAAGYPFGTFLALEKKPAISIATGKITALRREANLLAMIQFDADIQSGNSGGPLVTANGEVIGVVASRIDGSRFSFAIGSDLLRAIIAIPFAKFENFNPITFADRHKKFSFDLALDYLQSDPEPPKVIATLTGAVSGVRELEIKKIDKSLFKISGIPHPIDQDTNGRTLRSELIRISGNFTHTFTAAHDDLEFTIGGRKYFLSKFKLIYPPEEKAITTNGETIKGVIAGLSQVIVRRPGYSPQSQNFQSWPIVAVRPDGFTPEALKLEVKISTSGFTNTITRMLDIESQDDFVSTIFLPDERSTFPQPDNRPTQRKALEIKFDTEITDLDYGENGRFVTAFFAAESICHIIDCLTGETLHKIPAAADSIIATGQSSLFIANSAGVSKWDLKSGRSIFRDQDWFDGTVQDMAVGSGSDRFLAAVYQAFDRKDMTRVELRSQENGRLLAIEPTSLKNHKHSLISISERGTAIGLYSASPFQSTQGLLQLQGDRYEHLNPPCVGWLKPGPLDQILVSGTGQIGIIPNGFGYHNNRESTYGLVPTSHQELALSVPLIPRQTKNDTKYPGDFGLYDTMTGRALVKKIISLDGFINDPANAENQSSDSNQLPPRFPWDERFYYSVDHGHLISVPSDSRRILINPLDLKTILKEQDSQFLLIDSNAPIQVEGESFEAQLSLISSEETLSFSIIAAPSGFTISETGLIKGKVNPEAQGQPQTLIILVKANTLERFWKHTFYPK